MAKRMQSMSAMPVRNSKFGHWAFLIGFALTVIAGFIPQLQTPKVAWVLVALGLLVGVLNITARETESFLVATIALIIAADAAGDIIQLGYTAAVILGNIVTFVFPASLVVAFKTIWQLASEE